MTVIEVPMLRAALARDWGLADPEVEVHDGGMGSATWVVTQGGGRWVAKAVAPDRRRSFVGGLAVAAAVDRAGVPAGPPLPTRDGRPVATVAGAERFHWVRPEAGHLALRPWVRPAVAAAVAALEAVDPPSLTWGLLHTDPAPEHFRLDAASGRCGLIDWSVALRGPLLYDLASAVMYAGGPGRADALVAAYLGQGVLAAAEVGRALPALLRFRWAVQADYFAHRITTNDLTGIGGPADNERGLEDARRWLGRLEPVP